MGVPIGIIPTGRGNKLANIKYHTSAKFIVTNMDCLDNYNTFYLFIIINFRPEYKEKVIKSIEM